MRPGKCFVESAVGHHRRDDGAHAHAAVGLGDRIDSFARRHRIFDEQVVGGGAAFAHQFDRGQGGAEALVLDGAAAVDGAAGAEEYFERHAVADRALAEAAMAVRVAVDEAGHQQAVGRLDALERPPARDAAGRLDCRMKPSSINTSPACRSLGQPRSTRPPLINIAVMRLASPIPCVMCRPIS